MSSRTLGLVDHVTAAQTVRDAYASLFGSEPSLAERQFIQAIGAHEGYYGQGWTGDGVGSHNWGAVQAGTPPCDPATTFEYTDSNPQESGGNVAYQACFKRYPDDVSGAADLAKLVTTSRPSTWAAARRGDLWGAAANMYDTHYYANFGDLATAQANGFDNTRDYRVWTYAQSLMKLIKSIAAANNEPVALKLVRGGTSSLGSSIFDGLLFLGTVALTVYGVHYVVNHPRPEGRGLV